MLPGRRYTPVYVLDLIIRRRWLIVSPLVICTMAALIVSSSLPDVYQSDILIQVVPQRVPERLVPSIVTPKTDERVESVTQQVKSRTQLEQLITEFGLYPNERQRMALEDVIELMRANITTDLVKPNRSDPAEAFHVRFTYGDADIATKVTQKLGTLYIARNARERGKLAEGTDAFLQSQLADARRQLEAQEKRLQQFREQHAGRLPTQVDFNMQSMQGAQSQAQMLAESVARDRDRKMMLERLYNELRSEPEPAPVAAAPPPPAASPSETATAAGGSAQQQLEAARAALARARLRLKPEHPDVIRLTKTIAELEAKVQETQPKQPTGAPAATAPATPVVTAADAARRERLQGWQAEIESLDRQIAFKEAEERRQRNIVADFQHRVEAVPGLESEWVSLSRDYDTLNLAYQQLLSKSRDAKVAVDMENDQIGEQFRVLDPARVPVRPIGPNRIQVNAIGLGLGLILGLGVVALLELRDSRFKSESDVFEALALPVLALVPLVRGEQELQRLRRRRIASSVAAFAFVMFSGYVFWALKLWKHVI